MQRWTKSHKDYSKNEDEYWPRKMSWWRMVLSSLMRNSNIFSLLLWLLIFGLFCTLLNIYELKTLQQEFLAKKVSHIINYPVESPSVQCTQSKPVVWIKGNHVTSGYLEHVFRVFDRLGYESIINKTKEWDVLWSHNYPFADSDIDIGILKPYQLVNHFPGSGYITSKVTLTSAKSDYIPKAFKMPADKNTFLTYADENPNKLWVQKSNNHRGIKIQKSSELDLSRPETFVQEFIHNPLLIDGRKFDIGIYTILTSVDPLRVYVYDGDVLLRFCPEDYQPFDPNIVDKYVVGDNYTPTWEIASLKKYYAEKGFTHKESLNAYLRSLGQNPDLVWKQVREAIRNVFYEQVAKMMESINYYNYKANKNFFEMMRFDLILDEDLKVYIMEANMSPNLSSDHFAPNKLIYEQVLFNLLNLVGVASTVHRESLEYKSLDSFNMQVSDKDIQVLPEVCISEKCEHSCSAHDCRVCEQCLTQEERRILKAAYLEHVNRKNCRRIIPEPLDSALQDFSNVNEVYSQISNKNKLMSAWFQGKCKQDPTWCF